jgi:hypothetical protein
MNRLLGIVAIAVTACAPPAFAQPEPNPFATGDAEIELVQRIARLRAEGGVAPEASIEPLRSLALLYQEAGNDALAILALDDARHATRVHHGLTSAEEALLLRQQVRSEKALGNYERAWDLQQEMLAIARRHADDLRMVAVYRDLAEDRAEVLGGYRAGKRPPEIYLGCYYVVERRRRDELRGERGPPISSSTSCQSGSQSTVYRQLRAEILTYYADAIELIVRSGDFASQELRALEQDAIRVATFAASSDACGAAALDELLASDLIGTCLEPVRRTGNTTIPNVGGWASLVRLAAYETRAGAPASTRANAIAELADWHLLDARRDGDGRFLGMRAARATELYERAYRELLQAGDAEGAAAIFSPGLPVTLPTNARNPLAAAASSRYVDVSFDITPFGSSERIEIFDPGQRASRGEERELIRLIELTTFRPRVVGGGLTTARVAVRYYFGP